MLHALKSYFTSSVVEKKTKIVVVGGGTGGLTTASQLNNKFHEKAEIVIIEPSTKHYYQPLFTLVGGGLFKKEDSCREEGDLIPKGTTWIKDAVTEFKPEDNKVLVKNKDQAIDYDYLVVSVGLQCNWGKIKGLKENLGKNGVVSNYSPDHVQNTFEFLQMVREKVELTKSESSLKQPLNIIFTVPNTPIKCGGAPQKILYLADDYFRQTNVRNNLNIMFNTSGVSMFPVKHYSESLDKIAKSKDVIQNFQNNLVEIKGDTKEAVFETPEGLKTYKYDLIHVTPPMGPPDVISKSPLASTVNGFVDVDKETLQHKKYQNVFALGDCANLPTSKTAAAIASQAPVLVSNLISHKLGLPLTAKYSGYTSCPITTSSKKLILAEFKYDNVVAETLPFDQRVESYTPMLIKKYIFPAAYWNLMIKGHWFGPNLVFNPVDTPKVK